MDDQLPSDFHMDLWQDGPLNRWAFQHVSDFLITQDIYAHPYQSISKTIDNLMEDVATAEISRSQIWQWIRYEVVTREGTHVTHSLVEQIIFDILNGIERNENDRFEDAVTIFRQICLDEDHFPTFLTLSAYSQFLVSTPGGPIR